MNVTDHGVGEAVDAVLPLHRRPTPTAVTGEARARALASPLVAMEQDGYRSVVRQASVALFLVEAEGFIVAANPATCRLLGRSEQDVIGLAIADITHPDDVVESRSCLSAALTGQVESYRMLKRYLRGDGSSVAVDITVSVLRREDGVPIGFMAAAVDDTERATAQAHALASASLLRITVDSSLDPWVYLVAVRDQSGRIVDFVYADANQTACAHNHTTRVDLLGRRLLELLPEHAGHHLVQYATVVDTGVPLSEDDVSFLTGGELRYFSNRAVAVAQDGLSLTWRDTTEQVQLRRELAARAVTDPLTGLLNRDGLDQAAQRLGHSDRRRRTGAAVLYVDLDGLGAINRAQGHPGGDAVLIAVADRLVGAVRAGDVVARVGGDEFVVVAPGVDVEGAQHLTRKLAHAVTRPLQLRDGVRVTPTISIGVTVGSDVTELEDLITRADASMMEHKRLLYSGTDRYSPTVNTVRPG